MSRFRLSHLAKIDLAEIRNYIARDKPRAAGRQIARFFRLVHTLARNSQAGEEYPEFAGGDLRGFSVGRYAGNGDSVCNPLWLRMLGINSLGCCGAAVVSASFAAAAA